MCWTDVISLSLRPLIWFCKKPGAPMSQDKNMISIEVVNHFDSVGEIASAVARPVRIQRGRDRRGGRYLLKRSRSTPRLKCNFWAVFNTFCTLCMNKLACANISIWYKRIRNVRETQGKLHFLVPPINSVFENISFLLERLRKISKTYRKLHLGLEERRRFKGARSAPLLKKIIS